jgi:thymidylate synthase (FAD)
MGEKIDLLDHGLVRLIDHMGNDLSIVRNARVSHDAVWRTGKDAGKDERLINYLYSHQHNTPFEAVVFTFEVKAPIFVVRQWHRHRTWSYNEVSARYTELPEEVYVPTIENIGHQDSKNHQSRNITGDVADPEMANMELDVVRQHHATSFQMYRNLLLDGWPRELARTVLPVGTYTHMFATVNLNNLFKFLTERASPHAQYEIRVYAEALLELIRPIVPVAVAAWEAERGEEV